MHIRISSYTRQSREWLQLHFGDMDRSKKPPAAPPRRTSSTNSRGLRISILSEQADPSQVPQRKQRRPARSPSLCLRTTTSRVRLAQLPTRAVLPRLTCREERHRTRRRQQLGRTGCGRTSTHPAQRYGASMADRLSIAVQDECAVNKKKIGDVRTWLRLALDPAPSTHCPRILLLTGPAGAPPSTHPLS